MGIVSTNVAFVSGSGSGSGGANGVDLPTHLESLTANGGNTTVTLNLGYSSTDYVSGVQINYKLGDYPTSPSDGDSVTLTGAETSIKITGLTNKLTYYFRVFIFREVDGVKYYQTDITNSMVMSTPRTIELSGITPYVNADDHIVITKSGVGTISAPSGTTIILGSGADGTSGGYVSSVVLEEAVENVPFIVTVASGKTVNGTKVTIGDKTYTCGNTVHIVNSKWGPIGGNGGALGQSGRYGRDGGTGGTGTGAGGGGGGGGGGYINSGRTNGGQGGPGGNENGYGNKGQSGSEGDHGLYNQGGDGGNGGNGGYASGGGNGGYGGEGRDSDDHGDDGSHGTPGQGIVVIQ